MQKRKLRQLELFNLKNVIAFGGDLLDGKRKSARPLNTRDPIHLVLRSKNPVLRKHGKAIQNYWSRFSKKFGIKTYHSSLNSNHIHAIIRIHSRRLYNGFIQALTGAISKSLGVKWLVRPFTRIIAGWGRAFRKAKEHVRMNFLEAAGLVEYSPRKSRYPK